MENISLVLLVLFTAIIVLIVLAIIIIMKMTRRGSMGQEGELRRDIREEMSRSRRETAESVQGSIKRMSEMIAQNQRESAEAQNRRLAELNKQLASTSMSIEQRLENIRISMERKVTVMTEVGKFVDQCRVSVESEDDWFVFCKQCIVINIA